MDSVSKPGETMAIFLTATPFTLINGVWTTTKGLSGTTATFTGAVAASGLSVTGNGTITGTLAVTGGISGTVSAANALTPNAPWRTATTNINAALADDGSAITLGPNTPTSVARGFKILGFDGTSFHTGLAAQSDGSLALANGAVSVSATGAISTPQAINAQTLATTGAASIGGNATISGSLTVTGSIAGAITVAASAITPGGPLPLDVTIVPTQILGDIIASSVNAANINPGTFPSGVLLPPTQLAAGQVASGVTVPATQVSGGALGTGVTIPGLQVTGAIAATTVPASGVTGGTFGTGVYLPGGQVNSAVQSANTVPVSGIQNSGAWPSAVYVPGGQVSGNVGNANYANNSGQIAGHSLTVANSAPGSPQTNDIWIDTSTTV